MGSDASGRTTKRVCVESIEAFGIESATGTFQVKGKRGECR